MTVRHIRFVRTETSNKAAHVPAMAHGRDETCDAVVTVVLVGELDVSNVVVVSIFSLGTAGFNNLLV